MKRVIRWVATALHTVILVLIIVTTIDNVYTEESNPMLRKPPPRAQTSTQFQPEELLKGFSLLLLSAVTLAAIWTDPKAKKRTLFGLWLKRKRLEESEKIARLEAIHVDTLEPPLDDSDHLDGRNPWG